MDQCAKCHPRSRGEEDRADADDGVHLHLEAIHVTFQPWLSVAFDSLVVFGYSSEHGVQAGVDADEQVVISLFQGLVLPEVRDEPYEPSRDCPLEQREFPLRCPHLPRECIAGAVTVEGYAFDDDEIRDPSAPQ